jgi:hypothetical protein
MTKIAAALCARGLRAEAKDVLRKAIALAPHSAPPQSALILLLEEDLRAAGGMSLDQWAELEDLLRKSVIESPQILRAVRVWGERKGIRHSARQTIAPSTFRWWPTTRVQTASLRERTQWLVAYSAFAVRSTPADFSVWG